MTSTVRTLSPENIPEALQRCPHWVTWRREERDGKPTKVPYNAKTGAYAKVDDSATWTTFEQCLAAASKFDGLGFVLTKDDPFFGVDLDKCLDTETGQLTPEAVALMEALRSYTERSPSGTGIRIFCRGVLPNGCAGKRKGTVEFYASGRYLTLTGHHVDGFPRTIEERTAALNTLWPRVFPEQIPSPNGHAPARLSDTELLGRCRYAKNAEKFDTLWQGDWSEYASQSDADLALLGMLKFYSQDPGQLDRLFWQSGLMREKWDARRGEQTYGERTITQALASCRETYRAGHSSHRATPPLLDAPRTVLADAPYPLTDSGNAEYFAARHGAQVRFDHRRSRWLLWRAHRWAPDEYAEIRRLSKQAMRQRLTDVAACENSEERTRLAKWAISSESRTRLEALLSLAQAEQALADKGDQWDRDPLLDTGETVKKRYKAKSPGRIAAMTKLNQAGLGGMGGRRPTHGRKALEELLRKGAEEGSPIAVMEREIMAGYMADLGGEAQASAMDTGLVKRLVGLDLDWMLLRSWCDGAVKLSRQKLLQLSQARARNSLTFAQLVKALGGPGRRPAQLNGDIVIRRFAEGGPVSANGGATTAPIDRNDPPGGAF
jgi:hypothetical protein